MVVQDKSVAAADNIRDLTADKVAAPLEVWPELNWPAARSADSDAIRRKVDTRNEQRCSSVVVNCQESLSCKLIAL